MISYPVQVFTLGRVSGLFGVFVFAALFAMLLRVFSSKQSPKMPRPVFIILALLAPLVIFYLFPLLHNYSKYYSVTFSKTVVLYFTVAAISMHRNIVLFTPKNAVEKIKGKRFEVVSYSLAFGVPLAIMALAVFKNATGAIPPGTVLDSKYYYGGFIRAGGGYVDPNVLGVTVMLVLGLFSDEISRFRALSVLALGTALITALLTFSRTAQILFVGFVFFKFRKKITRGVALLFASAVAIIVIYYASTHPQLIDVFFQRYFNAEGESSTDDRGRQLVYFFNILSSASISDLFFGFGGQEYFQKVSGSAMHSAVFSAVLDAGVIPGLSILMFFGYSILRSFRARTTGFRVLAILSSFVLPYIPEMFFLLVIYVIVEEHNANLNRRRKVSFINDF